MACSKEMMNFQNVTDKLFNMFGELVTRETIYSIVDSCGGDGNHAANIIMSITNEETPVQISPRTDPNPKNRAHSNKARSKNKKHVSQKSGIETTTSDRTPLHKMSYAAASTSKKPETLVKLPENSFRGFSRLDNNSRTWTNQIKRIVTYHNQGTKTLIIMRGAPGSGKSYLACQIQEMTVGSLPPNLHIFSADDYFVINGYYRFEKRNLTHAHHWNQQRAFEALAKGVSPVIIDNTNIEYWEIQPYVQTGVHNGYLIEVVEPTTSWARNVHALSNRNKHGVPAHTIGKILESLKVSITSDSLMSTLGLAYPPGINPPVVRSLPKYSPSSEDNCSKEKSVGTLQEKQQTTTKTKTQDSKVELEDNQYCPPVTQNIMNSDSKAELSEIKVNTNQNQQIKYTIKEEGDNIKVILDIEKAEVNDVTARTSEKSYLIKNTEEKNDLNEKVETLAITEGQNIVLNSELIEQGESKNEITSNIDDKVEENNFHGIQNITPPPEPKGYKKDLQEAKSKKEMQKVSDLDTSKWHETREDQENNEKFIEEFLKVEDEWENGEPWEDDTKTNKAKQATEQLITVVDAKSPRTRKTRETEISLHTSDIENDWRKMYYPMTSFTDKNNLSPEALKNVVAMKSSETCMEFGDTDTSGIKNGYKVLFTLARDININYVPSLPEKIPENRKFDKSSMTNELPLMSGGHRCRNENKHFIRFRNMFKNLKKEDLRDIFDNCCGDVNWAVNIVMDAMPNKFECIAQDEQSDVEDEGDLPCDCTSFYEIIPDVTHTNIEEEHIFNVPNSSAISTETLNPVRKPKKDSPLSDSSLALKRQIEQNIVISDNHYSEHSLKIRKMRRGEFDGDVSTSQNIAIGITMQNLNQSDTFEILDLDTTNEDNEMQKISEPIPVDVVNSEYITDEEYFFNDVEKTVNINVGFEFISQLDSLFGRGDMTYSENIVPRINIPMSMLNELNALWMESLMFQFEGESKTCEEMIKKDEEFARELAKEQQALVTLGKEQDVPNFKQIMDMEYALMIYRRDCEELMLMEQPNDMATRLSRIKLHDLFPEIPKEDLNEIHMAYSYEFRTTVKILLESQGRTDITKKKKGVDKFIMAQETEKHEVFFAEATKDIHDERTSKIRDVNMATVNKYRSRARSHFEKWEKNFQLAKELMKKSPELAKYYKRIAGLYFQKYEYAWNVALISLMEINKRSSNSQNTIDLHHLRLREAMNYLNMFLDFHVEIFRMADYRSIYNYPVLYVITGRGLHSKNGPIIKPAARKLLVKRKLPIREMNPGLVSVIIYPGVKLSHEIT